MFVFLMIPWLVLCGLAARWPISLPMRSEIQWSWSQASNLLDTSCSWIAMHCQFHLSIICQLILILFNDLVIQCSCHSMILSLLDCETRGGLLMYVGVSSILVGVHIAEPAIPFQVRRLLRYFIVTTTGPVSYQVGHGGLWDKGWAVDILEIATGLMFPVILPSLSLMLNVAFNLFGSNW